MACPSCVTVMMRGLHPGGSKHSKSSSSSARSKRASRQVVAVSASVEQQVFNQLLSYANVKSTTLDVAAIDQSRGNGLVIKQDAAKKGEVLISVPKNLGLVLDYNSGLSLPSEGRWPRLQEGIAREDPLPWDLLLALAVLDSLGGDGGSFWSTWARAVLPPPESMTMPMTWGEPLLQELQHEDIAEGARKQQERLRALFPPVLNEPVEPGSSCSWLAWAFACVRSRAFKFGEDMYAFVPFLDMANHDSNPNADFRLAGDAFELFALKDIPAGQEVTINYLGLEGCSSQRQMAVYGFVQPEGNPADRLEFLPAAELLASEGVTGTSDLTQPPGLSLARMQSALGYALFSDAVTAKQPYLHAALKSLPFVQEDEESLKADEQAEQKQREAGEGAASTSSSSSSNGPTAAELALARALRKHCQQQLDSMSTTIDQDKQLLAEAKANQQAQLVAAIEYRLCRKQLIRSAIIMLDGYTRLNGQSAAQSATPAS